jgi:hypothetical protein
MCTRLRGPWSARSYADTDADNYAYTYAEANAV